jgi:hypothetical protein
MSGIWIAGVGEVDRSDARLRYPTWSHIWTAPSGGELWMGGTHATEDFLYHGTAGSKFDAKVTTKDFDAVATLYAAAGAVDWGVAEYRFGIGDQPLAPKNAPRVYNIVDWVRGELEEGNRVLVRCQAGLNRSGLITALTLCAYGMDGEEAIELIRSRRTRLALCNQDFELHVLEAYPAEKATA